MGERSHLAVVCIFEKKREKKRSGSYSKIPKAFHEPDHPARQRDFIILETSFQVYLPFLLERSPQFWGLSLSAASMIIKHVKRDKRK